MFQIQYLGGPKPENRTSLVGDVDGVACAMVPSHHLNMFEFGKGKGVFTDFWGDYKCLKQDKLSQSCIYQPKK